MKPLLWDSINPITSTAFLWDDPNYREIDDLWFYLEPHDEGFVPYANPATPSDNTQPKRKKHMPKSDYLKKKDAELSAQLTTFRLNIGNYPALGLTAAQITSQANDALYFAHVLACQDVCSNCSQQWTAWKDIMRDGGAPPASGAPGEHTFPPTVAPVAPGIVARFRALVALVKASPAYNTAIGEALGIEAPEQTGPDFTSFGPQLELVMQGGLVFILWSWLGQRAFLSQIEICVDRGDGKGFVFLAADTTPNYLDTTPIPATPAKWAYKAIYHLGDQRIGQWSPVVSITVGA